MSQATRVSKSSELRCPRRAGAARAKKWLEVHGVGLADSTVEAYARGIEEYLEFAQRFDAAVEAVTPVDIALYVRYLLRRPNGRDGESDLANATVQQRITAVRLFYEYLVEEGVREHNPVARGRYTPGNSFAGQRALVPRHRKLPWIPSDDDWSKVLDAFGPRPLRDRLMLAFAYDAALRREELCNLATGDIDPGRRMLRVRAETTKGHQERVVPYSEASNELYRQYLGIRRGLSRSPGPVFLSESRRNRGHPVTVWTWSKVTKTVADQAGLKNFKSHTLRHLCLTDLARAGWDINEIAQFAGHKQTDSTLQYIHLSGRDLARKLGLGMARVHARRVESIANSAPDP